MFRTIIAEAAREVATDIIMDWFWRKALISTILIWLGMRSVRVLRGFTSTESRKPTWRSLKVGNFVEGFVFGANRSRELDSRMLFCNFIPSTWVLFRNFSWGIKFYKVI